MFIERVKENFGVNEPIFTEEFLKLFPDYSRAQVFRFIKKSVEKGEINHFDKGVYYIPKKTFFGMSTISVESIIEKKYLLNESEIFGVYSGIKLLNDFSVTTQVPAVIEVVSNNESAKCREITIHGRRFILRRSRFKIDKDNASVYTILQLFNDFGKETKLNSFSKQILIDYMDENGITGKQLLDLSLKFPPRTTQNLIGSGLLNVIA